MMELNIAKRQIEEIRISIVIPVYNREKFIRRTLDSILNQLYRPLEIIVVDNNSTDNSMDICRIFKKENNSNDFRILLVEEKKKGANAARNKGLLMATGKYVSFYDSDDEMLPSRLSEVMDAFRTYQPDIVAFSALMKSEDGVIRTKCICPETSVINQILTGSLATQCFVARTELIRMVGGWNDTLFRWQDWELGIRIMLNSPNIYWLSNRTLDIIHVHPNSITGENFSSSYYLLLDSIHCVRQLIENGTFPNKLNLLEALYFRQIQLYAILKHEKRFDLSIHCYNDLKKCFCRIWKRWVFNFLAIYMSYGGRGTWRIARVFL